MAEGQAALHIVLQFLHLPLGCTALHQLHEAGLPGVQWGPCRLEMPYWLSLQAFLLILRPCGHGKQKPLILEACFARAGSLSQHCLLPPLCWEQQSWKTSVAGGQLSKKKT